MGNIIIKEIISWGVPFVCGGLISGLATYVKMKNRREKSLVAGVQCLLRAEIIAYHDKYFARGCCPIYAKESLRRMYGAYHGLGGNDVATQLYVKTMKLPETSTESRKGTD